MKPNTSRSTPATRTGNKEFDSNRPQFREFENKEKAVHGSPLAYIGDLVAGIKRMALDKNTWMFLGYAGAGLALTVSVAGYSRVLNPIFIPLLGGIGWLPAIAFSTLIASAVQYLQIAPRMPKYAPDVADELSFKLGLQRFVDPKEHKDQPSMLQRTKHWARTAHDRGHKRSELLSYLLYAVEFIGAFMAFPIFTATGTLSIGACIMAAITVFGFAASLALGNWAEQTRLTGRKSQKYRLQRRRLRQEADNDT